MTSDEKKATLLSLLANWENEVVEFKSGGKGFSSDEIVKYFSALSNEATLRGLEDVGLLDRIQKNLAVTAAAVAHLRREGLIEGRMPHPHISAVVAEATGQQAEYMRKKELPGSRYRAMLIDYIGKFNGLTRKQINDYMIPEIRGELSTEEKIAKISNLLTYMRRLGEITNTGSATKPLWKLSDNQ
ncbi:MAG: hypothetical protein IJG84_04910 [Kiritimatiellae bacterium]|nr:hypothetical protein [Kiritimatiellia bacterium]